MLERLARHAAECGESALAADALLELAEEDRRRHRYVDAETHYSAALEQLASDDARREPILAGRGKVRYRLQRFQESLEDLESARRLSEARSDDAAIADLLLEEATVLDWSHQWVESAARVERAIPIVTRLGNAALEVRSRMARGRTYWRQDQVKNALELLAEAAREAQRIDDHETRTISLLLLGPALASVGDLDESERRFAEVVTACEERGDALHLCVAFVNRLYLWMRRHQVDRATDDQRRAISLARDLGFGVLERGSTYNLAELLHWVGEPDQALELAQRSITLGERLDHRMAEDSILMARIQCARRDLVQAGKRLAWVREHYEDGALNAVSRCLARLVELQIRGPGAEREDWRSLLDDIASCTVIDEHLETLHAAATWAVQTGHLEEARSWLDLANTTAADSPIWTARIAAITSRLANA